MELKTLSSGAKLCSISLFSGGGIGDIALEWGFKIPVIVKCEILEERASLLRSNYPESKVFQGDIWDLKSEITNHVKTTLHKSRPWLIVSSPPCQGMSTNGAGRILKAIEDGKRSEHDERNRLIIPSIDIIEELSPDWFIFENVPTMENTVISNENNLPENIMSILKRRLGSEYTIKASVLNFSNYGVPQNRKRLITIGCRIKKIKQMDANPNQIFTKKPSFLHPLPNTSNKITLRQTIGHLEKLDSKHKLFSLKEPLHRIPKLSDDPYWWITNTPENESAFNNLTCLNCNTSHIRPETKELDLLLVKCTKCNENLSRPTTYERGWICSICSTINKKYTRKCINLHQRNKAKLETIRRLVKGFDTSYRRMTWDLPAKTITQNSGTYSSDGKGHPEQNRVLSILEILLIQTVHSSSKVKVRWNGRYKFEFLSESNTFFTPTKSLDSIIRDVIGESIPPLGMQRIIEHLQQLEKKHC